MSKREKEIWLDDAQWEGMMEGKHELEWLLRQVDNDIEQCKRSNGMNDYELPELIRRRNSILKDLNHMNNTMLRVHHVDELVSEDSEEINRAIEEYSEYVDPDLAEEFRRHEEDERREMEALEELEQYTNEINGMY